MWIKFGESVLLIWAALSGLLMRRKVFWFIRLRTRWKNEKYCVFHSISINVHNLKPLNFLNLCNFFFNEQNKYIHNWSLQPFSQDYWPSFSHHLWCVNVIHEFKVDSERQIFFWETFHSNFIYSQSFCKKSAERKSPKKYFSYFVLMSGLGLEAWFYV